jgi:hypothetical protein
VVSSRVTVWGKVRVSVLGCLKVIVFIEEVRDSRVVGKVRVRFSFQVIVLVNHKVFVIKVRVIVCDKFRIFFRVTGAGRDMVLACVRAAGRVSFRVIDSFKVTVMGTVYVSGKFRYINGIRVSGRVKVTASIRVAGRISFKETIIKNRTEEKFS